MNASFLGREWGAVTFVLTVLVGMVVVPLALFFGNHGPAPVAPAASSASSISGSPAPSTGPSPVISSSPAASPTR